MTDHEHDQVVTRTLEATLEPTGDGRTLELTVVPYNQVARVSDGGPAYDEMWVPGVFDKNLAAPNRVLVNFEHEQGFQNVIGRGVELRDSTTGLDGTFRILEGSDGDKALELINEQVLTGVSLEAMVKKSEVVDGVVKRVKARLVNIALCRFPAYQGAQVLAVRGDGNLSTASLAETEEPEPDEPDPLEPVPAAAEIDELIARVGVPTLAVGAVVRTPWSTDPARFDDDQWHASCVLDRGDRIDQVKERWALPVLEPNGDLNAHAVREAARKLAGGGTYAQPGAKADAARLLVRYYRQLGETAPVPVRELAAR